MFHANLGTTDRLLRITLGVVLLALSASGTIGLWGLVGIVPLATGLVNFCPLYRMLGITTRRSA